MESYVDAVGRVVERELGGDGADEVLDVSATTTRVVPSRRPWLFRATRVAFAGGALLLALEIALVIR